MFERDARVVHCSGLEQATLKLHSLATLTSCCTTNGHSRVGELENLEENAHGRSRNSREDLVDLLDDQLDSHLVVRATVRQRAEGAQKSEAVDLVILVRWMEAWLKVSAGTALNGTFGYPEMAWDNFTVVRKKVIMHF